MNYALILAGGTGSRAGGPLPKQFQKVGDQRILWRSVRAFKDFDRECRIVIVVHPDYLSTWEENLADEEKELGFEIMKTEGGSSRVESVKKGLAFLKTIIPENEKESIIFIHDSARPGIKPETIARGKEKVKHGRGSVPVIKIADSLRRLTPSGSVPVDRNEYMAVQTPQIFIYEDIQRAYDALPEDYSRFTDDASVAENSGIQIDLFEGDPSNFKITTPEDFKRL